MTREYDSGWFWPPLLPWFGEPERGWPRAGKGEEGMAAGATFCWARGGASAVGVRADPVGLMGLTH